MKKLLIALVFAAALSLSLPSIAYADGCNSSSCTSSGWFWEYTPYPHGCNWEYTQWYNGSWYYSDCNGSSSQFYL
jgi:hypothetical protein